MTANSKGICYLLVGLYRYRIMKHALLLIFNEVGVPSTSGRPKTFEAGFRKRQNRRVQRRRRKSQRPGKLMGYLHNPTDISFKIYFLNNHLFFLKFTQWQCVLSYDNSTAMYKFLKNLTPWRDSNPGSSVLKVDAMTTIPRHRGPTDINKNCVVRHFQMLYNTIFTDRINPTFCPTTQSVGLFK
jgi:hypothetical protein